MVMRLNFRLTGGRVPIFIGGDTPYILVDFPTRETFDSLYSSYTRPESRDKYWDILTRRRDGATLEAAAYPYAMSRERVRQIEAKFLRAMKKLYLQSQTASGTS